MRPIYLQHTPADLRILARMPVKTVVANAHADRADARIMDLAQDSRGQLAYAQDSRWRDIPVRGWTVHR